MEDFLRQNYSLLNNLVIIMSVITGLVYYKKYKETNSVAFIYYLVYVYIMGVLGGYTVYMAKYEFLFDIRDYLIETRFKDNNWWFTLFWNMGAALFFGFFYQKMLKKDRFKTIIKLCSISYLLLSIIYIGANFQDFFTKPLPIINILGAFIIILCSIFYFIEVLESDKILSFYKSLNFYISFANLFWWLIITPITFFYMYNSQSDWNFVLLKWQIYLFSNVFMYTAFTVGLIVSKPEKIQKMK